MVSAELGPEDLAEIREPDFFAVDRQHDVVLIAREHEAVRRHVAGRQSPSGRMALDARRSGGSFGGRGPWSTAPTTGHVLQLDAVAGLTQQQPAAAHVTPPDEFDRESRGARRRWPSSTSTYFGDAMLPSRTTSQSARSPPAARGRSLRAAGDSARSTRRRRREQTRGAPRVVTRVSGLRSPAFGVMTCTPVADDRVVRLRRTRESPRVGQLAAEVKTADEREEIADRRALRRAQRRRERKLRPR